MKKEVEGSASAGSAGNKEILIQIDEVEECLSLMKKEGEHKIKTLKIQKVPWMLREITANEKDYNPLVVSIGPYHHGKPELQFMEYHKRKMANLYAKNDPLFLQQLYTKVKNVAKTAREFYKDDNERSVSKLDDREFTLIMFIDGCFILQFIYCSTNGKHVDLEMKDNIAACVSRDLLLLENQLPFLVLTELMSLKFPTDEWNEMLIEFIGKKMGPTSKKSTDIPQGNRQHDQQLIKIKKEDYSSAHLLEIIRTKLVGKNEFGAGTHDNWSSYRSAKELKTAGIHFRPSKTRQLTDVMFKPMFFTAMLYLPPITVDDSMKSMLVNMVAYEACPDGPEDFGVTSYICFLDSLIDHAEDVKELRSKGILQNFLGSDQQVADLFNQIADNLVPDPYAYNYVKGKIEKHYKNKIKNWWAEFWHTHFTSPWTGIAFVGAVFALALSFIQAFPSLLSKEH